MPILPGESHPRGTRPPFRSPRAAFEESRSASRAVLSRRPDRRATSLDVITTSASCIDTRGAPQTRRTARARGWGPRASNKVGQLYLMAWGPTTHRTLRARYARSFAVWPGPPPRVGPRRSAARQSAPTRSRKAGLAPDNSHLAERGRALPRRTPGARIRSAGRRCPLSIRNGRRQNFPNSPSLSTGNHTTDAHTSRSWPFSLRRLTPSTSVQSVLVRQGSQVPTLCAARLMVI